MCNTPGLTKICRESYNDPAEVYARLKLLGMTLVTLTDHDSIDAAEVLRHNPDFFLSEEVTVVMPSGTEMHLGVYGMNERDHIEIQKRRRDFISLIMFLTERKLFFSVNHVFSGLTGKRSEGDFRWFASYVPALETRNGQMQACANESARRLANHLGKIAVGGSDSHTITGVGRTFTEVRGARTADEFFAGLRAGQGRVCGAEGSYAKLTEDVFHIVFGMWDEKPWTIALAPLALLVPFCTAGHWLNEFRFHEKWSKILERTEKSHPMFWDLDSNLQANWGLMG
ncbi:MAG TPA: PHP domain-containing protein [Candidatus Acidoferrum sp.]|nr:PHP domain-containing protein [Candidatus Acidoferrum sp.]